MENNILSPKGKVNKGQPFIIKNSIPLCIIGFRLLILNAFGVVHKNKNEIVKKNKKINKNETAILHKTSIPLKVA